MLINVNPAVRPELDADMVPAVLWNHEFVRQVEASGKAQKIVIAVFRSVEVVSTYETVIFPHEGEYKAVNCFYVERLIKFLLWMKGGYKVVIAGAPTLAAELNAIYSPTGARAFDADFMGTLIYGKQFEITGCGLDEAPKSAEIQVQLGGHLDGCRIGFDLGGSDRKCAAVMDGKVLHTEEVVWDPYFQKDPEYHFQGIMDSLRRAAAKLPRVDAIGGSAAGVYVNNQPRAASLFRGVSREDFAAKVVPMFQKVQQEFNNVPFVVVNDGEVTALAGAMSMNDNGVLGFSMGTSTAAGYVNGNGNITDWLNELAFVPVDYRANGPRDEWSGDIGCGVQYFSQQGVARLAKLAGIEFEDSMPFPKRLEGVQELMRKGDARAASIYRSIGVSFGYTVAQCQEMYPDLKNLLILGRVTSGEGGEIILDVAEKTLKKEFPNAAKINFRTPDEQFKRHGQAVTAASLPEIKK